MTDQSQDAASQLESQQGQGLEKVTSLHKRPSQPEQAGTQTSSQTRSFRPRGKRSRLGKQDPKDPSVTALEIQPSEDDLPFTTDKIRVGIGGDYLTLQLINDEQPVTIKNIADGETLQVRACRILATDCDNIVAFG